ncbi:MAG: hypothetical protein Q8O13_02065 [Candidatus Omnitrophota bacterium]|nr:hypothetical protein [Candidatus Omnitrophota bacterium]
MTNKKIVNKECRVAKSKQEDKEIISYRLKCQKTANGLSHFVMYGDVPKEKTLF